MSKATTVEELYPLVSEAILRAETLEDLGAPGTSRAFLDLSLLEERVTRSLPASHPEGAIARRGAVRAALNAEEYGRARELADRFLSESDLDADLRASLVDLAEEARTSGAGLEATAEELNRKTVKALEALVEAIRSIDAIDHLRSSPQRGVLKVEVEGKTVEISSDTFRRWKKEAGL